MARLKFLLIALLAALFAAPPALAQDGGRESLPWLWWLAPVGSIIALAFAWIFYQSVMKLSEVSIRRPVFARPFWSFFAVLIGKFLPSRSPADEEMLLRTN